MADDISTGELGRQVREVLVRFEGLATRLETQYVRTESFNLYKQLVDQSLKALQDTVASLASAEKVKNLSDDVDRKVDIAEFRSLSEQVKDLQSDRTWLVRLVIGFIVMGVLAAVFAVTKAGAG